MSAPGLMPINARVETAASKPLFREAWKSRRCLVPADGWYEWHTEKGRKQPYFFCRNDGEPVLLAGLWCEETFALLTTEAEGALREIHDRRPLALRPEPGKEWIDGSYSTSLELVRQLVPVSEIDYYPVNPRLSNPRMDGPDLMQRWTPDSVVQAPDLCDR